METLGTDFKRIRTISTARCTFLGAQPGSVDPPVGLLTTDFL